jgi:non-heme chloroperoxidase
MADLIASRRDVVAGASASILLAATAGACSTIPLEQPDMATFQTRDDVTIFYKDWGPKSGPAVVLCHGWPLSADSWDGQAFHLANNGFRVIAHDRRGHGRSSQPWDGNDMNHYADDLAQLIDHLRLSRTSIFGFSAGGGEVARYVGRHGTAKVEKLALISAVTPYLLRSADNPNGAPMEVFDGQRAEQVADRAEFFRNVANGPFYGFNRPGARKSQGEADSWWRQAMMSGLKNTYDCVAGFYEDFRPDVRAFDRPTLVIQGDDDQVVPIDLSLRAVERLLPTAQFKVYPGAPHGLTFTHREQLNADLLTFLRS